MFPHLFRTDSGFVYTFSAIWLLGLSISLLIVLRRNPGFNGWDGLLTAGILALGLGRFQFVLENAEWFAENQAARWNWLQGGHSFAGAALGALIGLYLWSYATQNNLRPMLSALAPTVPLIFFTGWLACYFDGCGYGAQTFPSWATAELPNNFGLMAARYQTQILGMITALAVGFPLWISIRENNGRRYAPHHFWGSLTVLAAIRALIYLLQGNTVPMLGQNRIDLLLALAVAALAIVLRATKYLGHSN